MNISFRKGYKPTLEEFKARVGRFILISQKERREAAILALYKKHFPDVDIKEQEDGKAHKKGRKKRKQKVSEEVNEPEKDHISFEENQLDGNEQGNIKND